MSLPEEKPAGGASPVLSPTHFRHKIFCTYLFFQTPILKSRRFNFYKLQSIVQKIVHHTWGQYTSQSSFFVFTAGCICNPHYEGTNTPQLASKIKAQTAGTSIKVLRISLKNIFRIFLLRPLITINKYLIF